MACKGALTFAMAWQGWVKDSAGARELPYVFHGMMSALTSAVAWHRGVQGGCWGPGSC